MPARRSRATGSKKPFAVLAAIALGTIAGACSHNATNAVSTSSTSTSTSTSAAPGTSVTTTPLPAPKKNGFPQVIQDSMAALSSTSAPLFAPAVIPVPPSAPGQFISATVQSAAGSYAVNLISTNSKVKVNSPSLTSPPYSSAANQIGSFGATVASSQSTATAQVSAVIGQLDGNCRSNQAPISLGTGISGTQCANGTGTTIIWTEGNWSISVVATNSLGPADTALANQVVAYLHTNSLPAPATAGVIKIDANGGPVSPGVSQSSSGNALSTSMTASWVEGSSVVNLSNSLDAMGGLQMTVADSTYS